MLTSEVLDNEIIKKGIINKKNCIWNLSIGSPNINDAFIIMMSKTSIEKLIKLYYDACFSPPVAAGVSSIKNNRCSSWSKLTT